MPRPSRRAVLALLLSPAACGFAPAYGPAGSGGGSGGGARGLAGAVRAADPDTDDGFAFVAHLEQRLGRPAAAAYDLSYAIETEEVALAIDDSNNITRFNIEGRLTWALRPAGGDPEAAPLAAGVERSFTGYAATGSTISTFESERDARRRLMVILADAVVARLLVLAPGWS